MKKLIYIIFFLSLSSCGDFLEEDMKSEVSTDSFYATISDAEKALNGSYSYLAGLYRATGILGISDMTGDVLTFGSGGGGSSITLFDDFLFNASSGDLLNQYETHYSLIGSVNTLLSRIEGRELNSPKQAVIVGEAKFLRGFAYFNLVRLFGGVPVRTEPATSVDGLSLSRDSEERVYEQILGDLNEAVNSLQDNSLLKGRANKIAAQTLLAKVHLTLGNYDESIALLEQVMGKRSLYPQYSDVFRIANENNVVESIFEVQYGLRPHSNDVIQFLTPVEVTGIGFVYGVYKAEEALVNAYEPDDTRQAVTLWTEFNQRQFAGHYIRKFNDGLLPGVLAADAGQMNFPVLRYADVLLMYAEALNAKNNGPTAEAYAAVQQVRSRAGLTAPLPEGLTTSQFLDVILKERLVEFAAEGHRWFDLKRTGMLGARLEEKGFVPERHTVFPIPQAAIDANAELSQNNGY